MYNEKNTTNDAGEKQATTTKTIITRKDEHVQEKQQRSEQTASG
jgi:hypothetical protein